jgi:SAM-dependent methyltransferase
LGRFAFLASRLAEEVDGVDMSPQAVGAANIVKAAMGTSNVTFRCADAERFKPSGKRYEVIYLGGVLQHLIEPAPILRRLRGLLAPQGLLVINAPSEANFRGDVSTTLGRLFDFPMTLAEVRQVNVQYMQGLCSSLGMRMTRIAGCLYSRAWGPMGAQDLITRIANVLDDVKDQTVNLRIRPAAFNQWVRERAAANQGLLDYLVRQEILKPIKQPPPFQLDDERITRQGLPLEAVHRFFASDFSQDPYYTEQPPFSLMGGQAIYVLKRLSSR